MSRRRIDPSCLRLTADAHPRRTATRQLCRFGTPSISVDETFETDPDHAIGYPLCRHRPRSPRMLRNPAAEHCRRCRCAGPVPDRAAFDDHRYSWLPGAVRPRPETSNRRAENRSSADSSAPPAIIGARTLACTARTRRPGHAAVTVGGEGAGEAAPTGRRSAGSSGGITRNAAQARTISCNSRSQGREYRAPRNRPHHRRRSDRCRTRHLPGCRRA